MVEDSYAGLTVETAEALAELGHADLSVYLANAQRDGVVLYCDSGAEVASPDYNRLREHGVRTVYVDAAQLRAHEPQLESRVSDFMLSDVVEPLAKVEIAHRAGQRLAQDLIDAPSSEADLGRASRFMDAIVEGIIADQAVAPYLMQMAAHHRSTASHMMIVSMLSIALGVRVVGENHQALRDLGLAAMLHDLGKLAIDSSVLNKPGRLTPEEAVLVQQHPVESVRLLDADERLTPAARRIILQHHERPDGRGYPLGLTANDLDVGSKILAIVDSFHAITGPRTYRTALTPAEANRVLNRLAGRVFDADLLACWESLCGRHGTRLTDDWAVSGDSHGEDTLATQHEHRAQDARRSEQRYRSNRFDCDGRVDAVCVYAGRLSGVSGTPDSFSCTVQNLSKAGACLQGNHPLFRGEVIHVLLNTIKESCWVQGVVAWCRQMKNGTGFQCGVRFQGRITEAEVGSTTDVVGLAAREVEPA